MTVQKVFVKNRCDGDGSNKNWPITFDWDKNHQECIKVYTRVNGVLSQTTNFTIQISEDTGNYEVFYPAAGNALASGDKIIIARELPLQQVLNLVNQGPFFADDIELTFDEVVMMCQQLNERLGRSLKVGIDIDSDSDIDVTIPVPTDENNYGLRMTKDGFQLVNDPSEVYDDTVAIKNQAEAAKVLAANAASVAQGAKEKIIDEGFNFAFENVAMMKSSTYLDVGVIAKTAGYWSYNDGGGALYYIRQAKTDGTEDVTKPTAIHLTNGLVAELIVENNVINIKTMGAYGDGTNADITTSAFMSAIALGYTVYVPKGIYLINETLSAENVFLLLDNSATLKLNASVEVFIKVGTSGWAYNGFIKGGNIDGNFKCNTLIGINYFRRFTIEGCRIKNFNKEGINSRYNLNGTRTGTGGGLLVQNVLIVNDRQIADTCGINDEGSDNEFHNVEIQDTQYGVKLRGSACVNVHHWLMYSDLFTGSIAFMIRDWGSSLESCVSDTVQTGIKIMEEYAQTSCANFIYYHNTNVTNVDFLNQHGQTLLDGVGQIVFISMRGTLVDFAGAAGKVLSDVLYANYSQNDFSRVKLLDTQYRGATNAINRPRELAINNSLYNLAQISTPVTYDGTSNYDNITTNGVYLINTWGTSGGINVPKNNIVGILIVLGNKNYIAQIFIGFDSNYFVKRSKVDTWSAWV